MFILFFARIIAFSKSLNIMCRPRKYVVSTIVFSMSEIFVRAPWKGARMKPKKYFCLRKINLIFMVRIRSCLPLK